MIIIPLVLCSTRYYVHTIHGSYALLRRIFLPHSPLFTWYWAEQKPNPTSFQNRSMCLIACHMYWLSRQLFYYHKQSCLHEALGLSYSHRRIVIIYWFIRLWVFFLLRKDHVCVNKRLRICQAALIISCLVYRLWWIRSTLTYRLILCAA